MIKSIKIEGFRGIRTGMLEDLSPLSVLVGPNGSGKSTILEAALIAGSEHPSRAAKQSIARLDTRESRWLVFDVALPAMVAVTTDVGDTVLVQVQISGDGFGVKHGACHLNGDDATNLALSLRLVDADVRDTKTPLHSLYTEAVELGHRDQVQEIVCEVIAGATGIEILTEGDRPVIYVVFETHRVPVSVVGDGIQRVLRLALELASLKSGTALMEQPEVFQHPGAIRLTAKAIVAAVRRDIQVILTTHSIGTD